MQRLAEVLLVRLNSYGGQVKKNGAFFRDYLSACSNSEARVSGWANSRRVTTMAESKPM
jgi:hypothetical protein